MKTNTMKKILSIILCIVMIAAMALLATGCNGDTADTEDKTVVTMTDGATLGEGETKFTFTVVDPEGKEITVEINTDKTSVGEALQELDLIAGDVGEYGLYVTTVNGITLDWDKDQKYWAFYIDGEYASTSVDQTEITAGSTYMLKAE